ncbi:MAG: hypothetical protein AMXMBFR57_20080 [Acidimicrobiia bacterium]
MSQCASKVIESLSLAKPRLSLYWIVSEQGKVQRETEAQLRLVSSQEQSLESDTGVDDGIDWFRPDTCPAQAVARDLEWCFERWLKS